MMDVLLIQANQYIYQMGKVDGIKLKIASRTLEMIPIRIKCCRHPIMNELMNYILFYIL